MSNERLVMDYLIQKATPKTPTNLVLNSYDDGEKYAEKASCPNCGYEFPDIGGVGEWCGEVERYDYCPMCGQNIDWSCLDAKATD